MKIFLSFLCGAAVMLGFSGLMGPNQLFRAALKERVES
jgi:hypothetical protein